MSPTHVHEVVNESDAIATSVHVHSPPLVEMRRYDIGTDSTRRVVRHDIVT